MKELFNNLKQIAREPWPVAITGESGTGKTTIGRYLHDISGRSGQFGYLNAAELTENTQLSRLFGQGDRVYSDVGAREGLVVRCNNGTLLIDECHRLSDVAQELLYPVLDRGEVEPAGLPVRRVSVRILFATDQPYESLRVQLRNRILDLVRIPPLRERLRDLACLARALARDERLPSRGIDDSAIRVWSRYDWPGNLHELWRAVRIGARACPGAPIDASAACKALEALRKEASPARRTEFDLDWLVSLAARHGGELTSGIVKENAGLGSRTTAGEWLQRAAEAGLCRHNGAQGRASAYLFDTECRDTRPPARETL